MMKRVGLLLLMQLIIWTGLLQCVNAQYYFYNDDHYSGTFMIEGSCSAGVMNSLTDLGGRAGKGRGFVKDLNWKFGRPCYNVYFMAMYREALGLRLELGLGVVVAYDSVLGSREPNPLGRYGRNLSFRSRIGELQLMAELHPLFLKLYEENAAPYCSPYLLAGFGIFKFNPKAQLGGNWYALRKLHLEGQGFAEYPNSRPYSLTQMEIPLGCGLRYECSDVLMMRIEFVYRLLFTDYLDDVSGQYIDPALFATYLSPEDARLAKQLYARAHDRVPGSVITPGTTRGNAANKDGFLSIQFHLSLAVRALKKG